MVIGLNIDGSLPIRTFCETCTAAKLTHCPFPTKSKHKMLAPGKLTYSDLWGPEQTASIQGNKYYCLFTDAYARRCVPYFIKSKDKVPDIVKKYFMLITNRWDKQPKQFQTDNGTKYTNQKLCRTLTKLGIKHNFLAPYSPQQNGVAKRFNQTLIELARAMLNSKSLPRFLWEHAVAHAAYIQNCSPTHALKGKTPHKAWMGEKPNVGHFCKFGCSVWILAEDKRSKLANKADKHIFVGFEDGSKAIRYYDGCTIRVSQNYKFNDDNTSNNKMLIQLWPEGERLLVKLQAEPQHEGTQTQNESARINNKNTTHTSTNQ